MPTTSNFGWTTPADTDLVKDGAAAIRTLGNGIDTSLVDLKGGTTGQNLRKASNTDLDFTFAGDATNTVVDAAGDLLYGTAADTLGRLAIGTAGQVLKVNSGATAPEWGSISTGKVLQVVSAYIDTTIAITSQTMTDTNITLNITPTSASSKVLVLVDAHRRARRTSSAVITGHRLMRGATALMDYGANAGYGIEATGTTNLQLIDQAPMIYLDSPATTSATTYKVQARVETAGETVDYQFGSKPSTITLMEIGA